MLRILELDLVAGARAARGLAVQPFKKGPDYIDPLWLGLAAGRPCYNLDPHLMHDAEIVAAVARQSGGADIALVEGNKGLYDGLALDGSNSNAALAKTLGLPVLLVLGLLGWADMKMNLGAAMIAAVSMGLSVDSSIHYITAFRRRLVKGDHAAALETRAHRRGDRRDAAAATADRLAHHRAIGVETSDPQPRLPGQRGEIAAYQNLPVRLHRQRIDSAARSWIERGVQRAVRIQPAKVVARLPSQRD